MLVLYAVLVLAFSALIGTAVVLFIYVRRELRTSDEALREALARKAAPPEAGIPSAPANLDSEQK